MLPSWPTYFFGMAAIDWAEGVRRKLLPPSAQVLKMATAYWQSEVVYALVLHSVFDLVHEAGGEVACADLAQKFEMLPDLLCRYMRAGAALNLLESKQVPAEQDVTSMRFSLTEVGQRLRSNVTGSIREFVLYVNEESRLALREASLTSWKTGKSGFFEAFGEEHFKWHADRQAKQRRFDAAMTALSADMLPGVVAELELPALNATFCDIGGGTGQGLAMFMQHYPELQGVLVDQPMVVENGAALLEAQGLGGRARTVAANILDPLPTSLVMCDVFFLKLVLHDWEAADAVAILRNVAQVARPGSRLITVDLVIGISGDGHERSKVLVDVHMFANHRSRERTLAEFRALLTAAGIAGEAKVLLMRSLLSAIEVKL